MRHARVYKFKDHWVVIYPTYPDMRYYWDRFEDALHFALYRSFPRESEGIMKVPSCIWNANVALDN